jgi:hypothetical protein
MHYRAIKKEKLFIQNNKEGVMYLMIKDNNQQFIINESSKLIIEMMLESTDTDEVLSKVAAMYDGVDLEKLRQDINDISCLLNTFGIIIKEDLEAESLTNVSVVNEDEYKVIEKFIGENIDRNELNFASNASYYTAINIRSKIMNNVEYYYKYVDKDGAIKGVFSAAPNINSSTVNITSIILKSDIQRMHAVDILKDSLDFIKNTMINKVNKLRVTISFSEEEIPRAFIDFLEQSGFVIEAVLEKERNDENTFFYSIIY